MASVWMKSSFLSGLTCLAPLFERLFNGLRNQAWWNKSPIAAYLCANLGRWN